MRGATFKDTAKGVKESARIAFQQVMTAYNDIQSTIGQPQGLDYAKMCTGAQGAQYDRNDAGFRLIDFCADVYRTVKETLDPAEMVWFDNNLHKKDIDFTVQTPQFMKFMEKVGQVFMDRHIYPVKSYFKVIKKRRIED